MHMQKERRKKGDVKRHIERKTEETDKQVIEKNCVA